mmetsp:Transcript_28647/g.20701  ORF Transcript_28647/g.20701 Transcript_28647/m.20701 type:complete len:92 (-) Transcript_28647:637-912(-)
MIKDKDNINNPQKKMNDASSIPYTNKENTSQSAYKTTGMGKTQFNPSHADPNISAEHQDQDGNSQMAHSLYDQEKNAARRNKIAEARSKQQ